MAAYNRVILVGNLTRAPEYKQLTSGQAVCRLGLATNRQFKNRQTGSMVQEVCYIDVDVWGAQAESCRQYLQKGRAVLIEGRLKFDTWQDQNGQTRNRHSIVADRVVFLGQGGESTDQVDSAQDGADFAGASAVHEIDKGLMDQIDLAKKRTATKQQATFKKKKDSVESDDFSTGEIDFKDESPFEDNLPF